MVTPAITWEQITAFRLGRHRLAGTADRIGVVEAVRPVGGIQAQLLGAAELGISVRAPGSDQRQVRDALWGDRSLVRSYGPRGTLHLLPADELPLWMAALAASLPLRGAPGGWPASLAPDQISALEEAAGDALDGRELTRDELAEAVAVRVGEWSRPGLQSAWGDYLLPLAAAGLLCFGPQRGARVTFVRADQWLGGWTAVEPRPALLETVRRYLAAYGPATPQDYGHWFWVAPAPARALFEALGDELVEVDAAGRRAWLLAADLPALAGAGDGSSGAGSGPGSVHLLPQYDAWVIGCAPRERVVPEGASARIRKEGRGRLEGATGVPVLLLDGAVAGRWNYRKQARRVEIRVEPFAPLSKAQLAQMEREAARIGAFLGVDASLEYPAPG
jgi:hypothetical protein